MMSSLLFHNSMDIAEIKSSVLESSLDFVFVLLWCVLVLEMYQRENFSPPTN